MKKINTIKPIMPVYTSTFPKISKIFIREAMAFQAFYST